MSFFSNIIKGATTLNPTKSAKHFVGSIVDPAGTTIREGRGQSSLPSNIKGYYDPGGALTPKVIGATQTKATPWQQPVLPPIGSHATLAPPLPGVGMSAPKAVPTMQDAAIAATAASAPGAGRALKTAAAPAYAPGAQSFMPSASVAPADHPAVNPRRLR